MKRAHSREAGMTLVEIMIAITLVSLLSVGMMMALRIGLNAMEKTHVKLMENRRIAGSQRILEQEMAGLVPVNALYRTPTGAVQPILFFQGEPQVMRFVSTYSLTDASRGLPQILELFVIPGEKAGVRLVMNELLYSGPYAAGALSLGMVPDPTLGVAVPRFVPVQARPGSFVLADRLAFCQFAYQEKVPPPDLAVWYTQWNRPVWPSAVRIDMASLDSDPAHLHMTTLTMPVRVAPEIDKEYHDDF